MQGELFTDNEKVVKYPEAAGWKVEGPSREAAGSISAGTIREEVLKWLMRYGAATADEAATALGYTPFTMRPRLTELKVLGLVEDSGERRANLSGRQATVWRVSQR